MCIRRWSSWAPRCSALFCYEQVDGVRQLVVEMRKLLVLGDSIACGYGLPPSHGWPDLLPDNVRATWQVENQSVPGETIAGGWQRWQNLAGASPNLLVVAFGLNDAHFHRSNGDETLTVSLDRERFGLLACAWYHLRPLRRIPDVVLEPRLPLRHFRYFLQKFRGAARRSAIPLLLLTPTPIGDRFHPEWSEALRRRQQEAVTRYVAALRDFVAQHEDVLLVDAYYLFDRPERRALLAADGIHLTAGGEALLAQTVADHISSL